jgi:selenide,water dikinase
VSLPAGAPDTLRTLLTDPQTSGGLLVACDPAVAPAVLRVFAEQGFKFARAIGRLQAGAPGVDVE